MDKKHQDEDANMREVILMNLVYTCIHNSHYHIVAFIKNTSEEVIQHLKEQNRREKLDALDLIEITSKRMKMQTIRHYTSHYLLDLKVMSDMITIHISLF